MIECKAHNAQHIAAYLESVPFSVDPQELYTTNTLYAGFDFSNPASFTQCLDQRVYQHFIAQGKIANNTLEALARNMHDFCMMQNLKRLLAKYEKKKVVAVMGGNAMRRDDDLYEKVARISKHLTENGSLMVSGGGSGAMEATGFGAWMAGYSEEDFNKALSKLVEAPTQESEHYLSASFSILQEYPQRKFINVSIPTWLYGHEWTSPFSTHIAKLFENSIREDTLLTIAYGGIIYAPGRAGTMQEVFQEAVQNHYLTFDFASPMIFLDTEFWTKTMPIYPILTDLMKRGIYKNLLLSLTDNIEEVVNTITAFQK